MKRRVWNMNSEGWLADEERESDCYAISCLTNLEVFYTIFMYLIRHKLSTMRRIHYFYWYAFVFLSPCLLNAPFYFI